MEKHEPRHRVNVFKKVLFLCTGNYYRSRFAEEIFNRKAIALGIPFISDSAALALERGSENYGPISSFALERLRSNGIELGDSVRYPKAVTNSDLESSYMIVAMNRCEHYSLVTERHPAWIDRITYWDVFDIEDVVPTIALAEIERLVGDLVKSLSDPMRMHNNE